MKELKMKTKELIKYFFSCGAVIYTAGSALILAISLSASESAEATILAPKPFLFFLGFAYILSLGNTLRKVESLSKPLRSLLHAICYVVGFLCFVLLCGVKFAFAIIFAAVFGIIYAIVTVTSSVIKRQLSRSPKNEPVQKKSREKKTRTAKSRKDKSEENTYQSRFS